VGSAPIPVTASVGTASTALRTVTTDDAVEVLHRLITDADAAMYAAKRDGGNRVRYCDPPRSQDA
jgi:GGDEF domain-containing protein